MTPLGLLGLDVGSIIHDAVEALVDLIVPDLGADWVSRVVTWLVALPDITGPAFPALNAYAHDLTAVGFGLLGATTAGGALQLWAGGIGNSRPAEAIRRAAIAAGILVSYPVAIHTTLVATNLVTAAMIRHPGVQDGLDKAFGEALIAGVVTSGVSLGLAVGAAFTLLYFLAALFVLKIGLTAALAVVVISGALVWGLYPLPQAAWLAQAWTGALVAALAVPVTWACIFAAAALLASDTLVFDAGGQANQQLGPDLASLVKPFAAVACFWLAYRAPSMLLGLARSAGVNPSMNMGRGGAATGFGRSRSPEAMVQRGIQTNADRFRALGTRGIGATRAATSNAVPLNARVAAATAASRVRAPVKTAATASARVNAAWRALPDEGRRRNGVK